MHVVHVIPTLGRGGAERSLVKLIRAHEGQGIRSSVVTLRNKGPLANELAALGVQVTCLEVHGLAQSLRVLRLRRLLKALAPDLVQTWMYHADLLGGLAASGLAVPVVWNVRHASLGPETRLRTRMVAHLCAVLSPRVPDRIVFVSEAACAVHVEAGFDAAKAIVIPNGYHVPPEATTRQKAVARRVLGIPPDETVVLHVGRRHPVKGHDLLLEAAQSLAAEGIKPLYLLCGDGVEPGQPGLEAATRPPLQGQVRLLGPRDDVGILLQAGDLLVSSSRSEGFPNAVAEAMAAGIPCVVTKVGASPEIVGSTGWIVAPDAEGIASGLRRALEAGERGRRKAGALARARIAHTYTEQAFVEAYASLYREVAATAGAATS